MRNRRDLLLAVHDHGLIHVPCLALRRKQHALTEHIAHRSKVQSVILEHALEFVFVFWRLIFIALHRGRESLGQLGFRLREIIGVIRPHVKIVASPIRKLKVAVLAGASEFYDEISLFDLKTHAVIAVPTVIQQLGADPVLF